MQDDALGLDAVQRRGDVGQHADIEDQDVTGPDALGRDLLGGHGRAVEPAAGIAANLAAWFMIGASQGTLLGQGPGSGVGSAVRARLPCGASRCVQTEASVYRRVGLPTAAAGYGRRVTVDHEGPRPVYLQVADILRAAIERGELVPDRAISSESRLMQEHGIARETARKAVRVLVGEGLVYVVQGRGAYVTKR